MPSSGFGHHFTNGSIFPIFFSCLFSTSPLDFNTGSTGQRHENSQQIKCHSFFFGFLHSLVLARGVEATPSPSSEGGSDWPGSRPMAGGGLASDVNSTPPLAPVVSLVMKRIIDIRTLIIRVRMVNPLDLDGPTGHSWLALLENGEKEE